MGILFLHGKVIEIMNWISTFYREHIVAGQVTLQEPVTLQRQVYFR